VDFAATIQKARAGVGAITTRDERWPRADIKSISLLPNILAKQKARDAGAYEAVLIDQNGYVTEGSSTNMWIVKDRALITRSAVPSSDFNILNGITRQTIHHLAEQQGFSVEERAFTPQDALSADEMFLTSSTGCVTPITCLDGTDIGSGTPGPVSLQLIQTYADYMDVTEA